MPKPAFEVSISRLTDFDAARCAQLEDQLFVGDNPWSVADFQAEFANPATYYVGIRHEDQLVAYAGIAQLGNNDPDFEVHTIGVDPAYQGQGLGRQIFQHCMDVIDAVASKEAVPAVAAGKTPIGGNCFLEVRTDNEPAIGLYKSFGFMVIATRENYYQPSGADAYVMQRPQAPQAPQTPETQTA